MAEEEGASRTEEATPHKLAEARKKGDVAKTQDLPQWASLAAVFSVLAVSGGWFMQKLVVSLTPFIAHADDISVHGPAGVLVMRQAFEASAPLLVTVLLSAAAAGVAGHLIQHGFLWTPSKLAFDFKKLSPMAGLKRMFGVDSLVQFFKTLLKVICVGIVCWLVMKPHATEMANLAAVDPMAMLPLAAELSKALFYAILALMALTAGADWFWQRFRFLNRMKMSKEEIKDEYKQQEGDPHIKGKLRQIRMEKGRRRMMANVAKATVVVMNPTHYAVALRYEEGETAAPQCVAKGLDDLALKIRAIAEEAGVAVVEDPPLARALYAAVEVDDVIPPKHYEAVAKVIGFVMNGAKRGGAERARPLR